MNNNEDKELFEVAPENVENNEVSEEIKKEDFELVQSNVKIYDKKLETKPTTFFKDALKRFRKNKSSVVGAIIVGILILLAIIVPIVSPKDIDTVRKPEKFLAPKLFDAGFGFWDGTIKKEHIVYDVVNKTPANYLSWAVMDLTVDANPTLIDQASEFGHNGYVMFENEFVNLNKLASLYSKKVNFDKSKDYVISLELADIDKVQEKDLGEYRLSIIINKKTDVRVDGYSVEWKRLSEEDYTRKLEYPLVKVRINDLASDVDIDDENIDESTKKSAIEWCYLGGEYQDTGVSREQLLAENPFDTVEVRYDVATNSVQYKLSSEDEFHTILNPTEIENETAIEVRVNEDKEEIEWKFVSESETSWRAYEKLSNLDDGTGLKFDHYVLKDFSKDYGTVSVNISEALESFGLETLSGHFCIDLKSSDTRQYILIKSISITALDDSSKEATKFIDTISFDDATQMVIRKSDVDNYWYCTGRKGVHQSELYYCNFKYDTYAAVYVTDKKTEVFYTELEDWKKQGLLTYSYSYDPTPWTGELTIEQLNEYRDYNWLTYDYFYNKKSGEISFEYTILDTKLCPIIFIDESTLIIDENTHELLGAEAVDYRYKTEFIYEILSDECPIDKIIVESAYPTRVMPDKINKIKATSRPYLKMGYKSMPRFLFGTNASGNDLFKKAFSGLRTSLILGVCTAAFCFIFGLVWGSISGYFGGNVDLFMERFCDILSGVPWIVIMTLCILHLGNNFLTFFLALCMTGWMGTAGRTRTQFYRFKGREYVLASRTLGASDRRLIFRHILPNSLGTIVTGSVLMIPSVIFSEATLAYLNLGLQGVQSFGVMMAENQKYLETSPYLVVFPAVIIALMMISFNLFGNGLRDAINPSLKGSD